VKFVDTAQHFSRSDNIKSWAGLEMRQASICSSSLHPLSTFHQRTGNVCAALQAGGHVSMVTSHLWLSVQQSGIPLLHECYYDTCHTTHRVIIAHHGLFNLYQLYNIGVQSLACNLFEHVYVTNEHVTGEAVSFNWAPGPGTAYVLAHPSSWS